VGSIALDTTGCDELQCAAAVFGAPGIPRVRSAGSDGRIRRAAVRSAGVVSASV